MLATHSDRKWISMLHQWEKISSRFKSEAEDDVVMVEKSDTTSRRSYLKYAGGAMAFTLAGCSGSDGDNGDGGDSTDTPEDGDGGGATEPNHPTDHSDAELSDAEKTGEDLAGNARSEGNLKEWDAATVQLVHKPSGDQACANCTLYVPDANDDGYGACTAVEGTIHPCDFCVLYSEYQGEIPDPCEQV
jgi:hypothetical protein